MAADLSLCAACSRDFVYPVEWFEASAESWHVTLRCGNCGVWKVGVYSNLDVAAFDDKLDDLTETLVHGLRRLERETMALEVESFAAALEAGAILPEDFGHGA